MNTNVLKTVSCLSILIAAAACSDTQEVEVTGEVSSAATVSGPISLEFFEIAKDGEDAERVSIKQSQLDALGAFNETLEVSEDIIIVVALEDKDGDGKCTAGELWAEGQQEVTEDGTVPAFALELKADPCPSQ